MDTERNYATVIVCILEPGIIAKVAADAGISTTRELSIL